MLRSVLHIGFVLVWAVLAFELIRTVAGLWRASRRVAAGVAFAVACAFFLGATGPLTMSTFTSSIGSSTGVAPALPIAQTPATCPRNAVAANAQGVGYIDAVGSEPSPSRRPGARLELPSGSVYLVGWAALKTGIGKGVCVLVNGRPTGAATYGLSRPDVAAATGIGADAAAGYNASVRLTAGRYDLGIGVIEADGHSVDRIPDQVTLIVR